MACVLEKDVTDAFAGTTLYSSAKSVCLKPTCVYLPPAHALNHTALNVVIWLHGLYVKDQKYLFKSDPSRVRQQVLNANRDVVLIAPFLGYGDFDANSNPVGNYRTADLATANWGERYLDEVLGALARFIDPTSPPRLDIKNLVIACHSGGGVGMRNLVDTLGRHDAKLLECWGLDCLYRSKAPDDATFWYDRAVNGSGCPLYVFYGPSTIRESVKLNLMARGKATREGNVANPPGPVLNDIHVTIGHYENFAVAGQIANVSSYIDSTVDDLMTRTPANAKLPKKPPPPQDGDYVAQAASNLKGNYIFPDDVHYFIAKAFFFARLRDVRF